MTDPFASTSQSATTYTVLNRHGSILEQGCSLAEAAQIVMGYNGHEYEIRPAAEGEGFALWISTYSRNSSVFKGLTKSMIYSVTADQAMAETEIYQEVIRKAHWFCGCSVQTDDEYVADPAER